jgi:hypothetical protein
LAVAPRSSDIWATDPGFVRIRRLSTTGRLVATCAITGLPVGEIAVGPTGDVFSASAVRIGVITSVRPPAPPCDGKPPILTSLRLVPSPLHARRATGLMYYTLSEPATVKVTVERRVIRDRKRPAYVFVGRRSLRSVQGLNRKAFPTRLDGRRLRAGSYRAKIVAVDYSRNRSSQKRLRFRVVDG